MSDEVVVERSLGGRYRLPDNAVDLEAWLRDGLEVYNLFVLMKPLFFEMLAAQPGAAFEYSARKANADPHVRRLRMGERREAEDSIVWARLVEADPADETIADPGWIVTFLPLGVPIEVRESVAAAIAGLPRRDRETLIAAIRGRTAAEEASS